MNNGDKPRGASVTRYSETLLPTAHGTFRVIAYRASEDLAPDPVAAAFPDSPRMRERFSPIEHLAIVSEKPSRDSPLVRIHSECLTGEVLQSLKCDCRPQLDMALQRIALEGGAVLYLRQEGRGIGLGNKLRAYALQEQGHDTVDANRELGFEDDQRSYEMLPDIVHDLGFERVRLMTNNPAKIDAVSALGIDVFREAHQAQNQSPQTKSYLETKRARMGHLITKDR